MKDEWSEVPFLISWCICWDEQWETLLAGCSGFNWGITRKTGVGGMWRHHNPATTSRRPKKSGRPKIGRKRRKIGPTRPTEKDRLDLTDGCDDDRGRWRMKNRRLPNSEKDWDEVKDPLLSPSLKVRQTSWSIILCIVFWQRPNLTKANDKWVSV